MNVDSITSKILALPETGCDEYVARQIAKNCIQFFESPRKRFITRIKHDATLPRTVLRTQSHCIYILQVKGGADLLGTGEFSKVGRVLVIDQSGLGRIDAGRVVFDKIAEEKHCNEALKRYHSPFLDKAAWATFDYVSTKTEDDKSGEDWGIEIKTARCLFVKECLAFDAASPEMRELPVRTRLSILADVAEGLAILHEDHTGHCDVKPHNFRVREKSDESGGVSYEGVLADMGFMKKIGSQSQSGSPVYCPPEFFSQYKSTAARDLWAFGMSLYQILKKGDIEMDYRSPDFIEMIVGQAGRDAGFFGRLLQQVTKDDLTPEKLFPHEWSILPNSIAVERIIRACFSLAPSQRPAARQVSYALRQVVQAMSA